MNNIKKISSFLFLGLQVSLLPQTTLAFCPVCTIAVGAGVGLSRWLGVDDTVTGLWVGALILSVTLWTLRWFAKKQIRFRGAKTLTALAYYALFILPLYWTHIIGHPKNTLWGTDKLILGVAIGGIGFGATAACYEYLKRKNNGHAYFPFQKIAMPIGALVFLSIVFYFLTK